MLKGSILAGVAIFLVGCSTDMAGLDGKTSPELASDWDVCYVSMTGSSPDGQAQSAAAKTKARAVISERKIDCGKYANQVATLYGQRVQQSQAALQAGTALLAASQPKPAPAPMTPIRCRQVGVYWECF